jgi:hypothetical protein
MNGTAGAIARFTDSMRALGPLVLAPATLTMRGLGIWLVLDSDASHFRHLWVQLRLGLFAGTFLIGAAYQSRTEAPNLASPTLRRATDELITAHAPRSTASVATRDSS